MEKKIDKRSLIQAIFFGLVFVGALSLLSGCATGASSKIVDVATVPGTDKRCVMGFCYEREREIDIEGLKALTDYLAAQRKAESEGTE